MRDILPLVSTFVVLAIFLALVVDFAIRAWRGRGKLSATDRWALISGFVTAVTTFALAHLLINWVVVPTAPWLVAVGLLAGGVVGAVLRWSELPWFAEDRMPIRRVSGVVGNLLICALIVGVAFI